MSRKDKGMWGSLIAIGAAVAAGTAVLYHKGKQVEQPMSFDDFVQEVSNYADHFIISSNKKTGLHYYGGECSILITNADPQNVLVQIKVYAQDQSGQWQASTITHKRSVSQFTKDAETLQKIEQIKRQPLQMKVTAPEQEGIK